MKKKFYVVWVGHQPGIYDNWPAAQKQIQGFSGAQFKGFPSLKEAETAFQSGVPSVLSRPVGSKSRATYPAKSSKQLPPRIPNSLAVDAACSGNPGPMEYQGVITQDGRRIFHQAFPMGTNNIGEFLALVHALAYLQAQNKPNMAIYTDSKIAMGWVAKKKAKTLLKRDSTTEPLYQMIARAEEWLASHTYHNPIYKWPTEVWGEIPADFGRK